MVVSTREDISVRPFCLAFEGWCRRIVYTDFQGGKENVVDVTDWPRPWQIYQIEILKANAADVR